MDRRERNILLGIVLAMAAALRLWNYWQPSYSNDELSALARLDFGTLKDLIAGGVRPDGHPAAAQVLLWHVVRIFGDREAWVRLPFVLAGIGAVLYMYRTGRAWHSASAGLLMAAALATLEFPLLYSRIARPYALGLLFATMAAYHWVRIVRGTHTARNLWLLAISLALCAYTHYFCGLTAAVMALTGTLMLKGDRLRQYLYALGGAIVLFLPHLATTLHQLSMGGVAWVGIPQNDWPVEHLAYILNDSYMVMAVLGGIGLLGWVVFRPHRRWTQWMLPLAFFLTPMLIGFFYSKHVSPVLQHSVLLFSFPFLLVFIFSGWEDRHRWFTVMSVILVLATGVFSTVHQNGFYRTEHFGVFRQLAERAVEWRAQLGTDLLLVADVNHPSYLDRYLERTSIPDLRFADYRVTDEGGLLRLKRLMAGTDAHHLVYAHSTLNQTPEVERIIREKYPMVVGSEIHFNSGITLFRKGDAQRHTISRFNFDSSGGWMCDTIAVQTDSLAPVTYTIGGERPYGPTWTASVHGLAEKNIPALTIYLEAIMPAEAGAEMLLVMEQWSGEERYVWEARPIHVQIPSGEHSWAIFDFPLQPMKGTQDVVKVYAWSASGHTLRIQHLEVRTVD
ncbi:MAG: glycosyltransferase family 39 protein [Flavobacteriales bacterium]|nr:glycosyltransferase family 39 protein [Flavobacteriales bacterium]